MHLNSSFSFFFFNSDVNVWELRILSSHEERQIVASALKYLDAWNLLKNYNEKIT